MPESESQVFECEDCGFYAECECECSDHDETIGERITRLLTLAGIKSDNPYYSQGLAVAKAACTFGIKPFDDNAVDTDHHLDDYDYDVFEVLNDKEALKKIKADRNDWLYTQRYSEEHQASLNDVGNQLVAAALGRIRRRRANMEAPQQRLAALKKKQEEDGHNWYIGDTFAHVQTVLRVEAVIEAHEAKIDKEKKLITEHLDHLKFLLGNL